MRKTSDRHVSYSPSLKLKAADIIERNRKDGPMMSLDDMIKAINSATYSWSNNIYFSECFENRIDYEIIDDSKIILTPGRGIDWGMRLDWGNENKIKEFYEYLKLSERIEVNDSEMVVLQNSIPRLQDEYAVIQKQWYRAGKYYLRHGYSSYLAYIDFRRAINCKYKSTETFLYGIESAIDSVKEFFNPNKKYLENINKKTLRILSNVVFEETIPHIYAWLECYYGSRYVEQLMAKVDDFDDKNYINSLIDAGGEKLIKRISNFKKDIELNNKEYNFILKKREDKI